MKVEMCNLIGKGDDDIFHIPAVRMNMSDINQNVVLFNFSHGDEFLFIKQHIVLTFDACIFNQDFNVRLFTDFIQFMQIFSALFNGFSLVIFIDFLVVMMEYKMVDAELPAQFLLLINLFYTYLYW